jgi:hypothetical protein
MITDSALNLALAVVSLSRSLYDRMDYIELQKYLQNYKYKNNNFEYARNILLEAKYYNPYTLMFSPMTSMMKMINSSFSTFSSASNVPPASNIFNISTNVNSTSFTALNGSKYVYKREVRSNNGNGYIKEENYSYNGKDKPTITSTYRTITNGKNDGNKTIKN